jgi:hypothetical protein
MEVGHFLAGGLQCTLAVLMRLKMLLACVRLTALVVLLVVVGSPADWAASLVAAAAGT